METYAGFEIEIKTDALGRYSWTAMNSATRAVLWGPKERAPYSFPSQAKNEAYASIDAHNRKRALERKGGY